MGIVLENLIDQHMLGALRQVAEGLNYQDGCKTAGSDARRVKSNTQAAPSPASHGITEKLKQALLANGLFQSYARPKQIVRMIVSRYGAGNSYGTHVDDALMDGLRTDISFTCFLSAPETYEGGALEISDGLSRRAFKLPAAGVIIYPSNTLHRVLPVTSGTRLAVVGWATSWVRDPAQREVLHDLDAALAGSGADQQGRNLLLKTRSNLLRMWAE